MLSLFLFVWLPGWAGLLVCALRYAARNNARPLTLSCLDQHDDLLGLESDAEGKDGDAQEGGGCVDGFGR